MREARSRIRPFRRPRSSGSTTGGTIGGPIHRDKTHFFGSFERNDQDQNSDATYDLPSSNCAVFT